MIALLGRGKVAGCRVSRKEVGMKLRLGLVGGRRGMSFRKVLELLSDRVCVSVVCDLDEDVLALMGKEFPRAARFSDYEEMLEKGDCEAVLLATPMHLHAAQAVAALRSGRHVLSEVVAATTSEECRALVDAVEETKKVYMLAENYCYSRSNMMILNMVRAGMFGEVYYAEGAYIHDCRTLLFDGEGNPTWRGRLSHESTGNWYPTHSLGPVAQWLGINRGDRLATVSAWSTAAFSGARYAAKVFDAGHPAAEREWWCGGDSVVTVLKTLKGAVIVLRLDVLSPRPHNCRHYVLQGDRGAYLSPRHEGEEPLVWIEGRSVADERGTALQWDSLWKYAEEFEHPEWKEWGSYASGSGHGGGDFLVVKDFVDSVLDGKPPAIDVYDAVTWSCVVPLSAESIRRGGVPLQVPDFRFRAQTTG